MISKWWQPWSLVVLSVLSTISMFLGWTVSGSRVRNSFETFRAAQRLGLEELMPWRVGWFLVPVCTVAVACLAFFRVRSGSSLWPAAGLVLLQCVVTGLAAVGVLVSIVPAGLGVTMSIIVAGLGFVVLAAGVAAGWWRAAY